MDKGTFSNIASCAVFGAGLLLPQGLAREYVLSVGLFAFSGGITNSLAVKMLFDKIPGLIGSGVIPARFREIRAKIKGLIMEHFFSEEYLTRYLKEEGKKIPWESYLRKGSQGSESRNGLAGTIEAEWERIASPSALQPLVDDQIEKLMDSSIGGLLMMVGTEKVKPAVTQFMSAFAASMKTKVITASEKIGSSSMKIELDEAKVVTDLRANVNQLLERKLEELHPQAVKRMMEDVIRHHLGWLVVWGNVFGGLLGVIPVLLKSIWPLHT